MKLAKINRHEKDIDAKEHENYAENHIYLIKGKSHLELDYKSVTTFIKQFFEPFNADEIIKKYYDKWQQDQDHKYFCKFPDEIKQEWEELRNRKATKGTYMHRQFELYFNDEDYDNKIPELKEFEKWINENNIIAYRTEMTVYSERMKLVGNIDLIFQDNKGVMHICDFKRILKPNNNSYGKVCSYPFLNYPDCDETKHAMQLSIYKKILEEEYGFKIDNLYNLYIINEEPYLFKQRNYIEIEGVF